MVELVAKIQCDVCNLLCVGVFTEMFSYWLNYSGNIL